VADDLSYEEAAPQSGELSYEQAAQPGELSYEQASQPPKRVGGLIHAPGELAETVPQFFNLLGTPEGRAALWRGTKQELENLVAPFKVYGEAAAGKPITPEQEIEGGIAGAMLTMGTGTKFPFAKKIVPILQEFNDTVMSSAAVRLDAFARTGSSDGVKLEPPIAGTVPEPPIKPPAGAPEPEIKVPSYIPPHLREEWIKHKRQVLEYAKPRSDNIAPLRRSEAAQTGDPLIDMVINHPLTQTVIDRPIVDRSHTIPYMAGGSAPLANPTIYVEKSVPKTQTVNGITFDPADPWIVHENVEQTVMEILIENGMAPEQAYRTAHFGWAEPAEQAWYRAHGIDQEAAEAEQAKWLPRIQHENATDIPADLYDKPYPGSQPGRAHDEAIAEAQPTPEEMARARDIIRNAPELQPRSAEPVLQQARSLGVIGPEKDLPVDEKPATAAQRAIPASRRPDDKITMTPAGEPIGAWEARFKDWVSRVKEPEDVKPFIERAAEENNNFPEARAGSVPPEHVEVVAKAAGINAAKIDVAELSAKFNTPDKIRMVKQALDVALQDFKAAKGLVEDDPSIENIGKMLEAEVRRDYVLEYTVGLRAEWGRTGHALRDLLEAGKGPSSGLAEDFKTQAPKEVTDVVHAAREFADKAARAAKPKAPGEKTPATEEEGPLGLMQLIKTAEDLVEAHKSKTPGEKTPEVSPEVKELIKTSEAVVNLMRRPQAGEPPALSVRPLRQLHEEGKEAAPRSPLASFNALISEAERNVTAGVKAGKEPKAAMPQELRDMVGAAENLTKFLDKARLINELLASKGRTPKDMADFARATRGLDDEGMARALTNMRGKGPGWLHWAVSQALISGVITHTFYTGTNLMFMELERVVAPTIAAMFDRIRGNPDPVLFGEIGAAQRAIISSIPQAFQASKQAFKTGLRVPLPRELELLAKEAAGPKAAEKAMVPYTTGQTVDWGIMRRIASDETLAKVERYGGLPGRSANFQHTFFKNLSFHASMDSQAYRMAAKEGLDPKSQEFATRQAFLKANPTDAMIEKGVQDGYSGTFMEQLGEKTAAFSRMVRDTPLQWVFFFTHIPMNIARAGVRYTAPYLGKEMRADMLGENGMSKQNLAYAKWTLGSSLMGYAVYKGLMDEANGSYPSDPDEKRRWQMEGRPTNSIKAFDQWWSLERLGPPGIAFKLGADLGYIIRSWDHQDKSMGENITNAAGHLAIAFANAYSTEAGFQGVANLMDLLQGKRTPAEWGAYQGASFAQPVSMLSQAASFTDPHMREARTLIEGIMMRLPGLRQKLEPKLDPVFGTPMPNPGYHSIERHAPVTADPIKLEMEHAGYFPAKPSNHVGGVKLTPELYHRYQATAGPLAHEILGEMIQQPEWETLPAGLKKQQLQKGLEIARKAARDALQAENPELVMQGMKNKLERAGLEEEPVGFTGR
jgi:hypothetical protein